MSVGNFLLGAALGVAVTGAAMGIAHNKDVNQLNKQFNTVQDEVTRYVLTTGNGEWSCSIAGRTITLNGQEVKNGDALRKLIVAGIKNGSCRAHLNTASRPSAATPAP